MVNEYGDPSTPGLSAFVVICSVVVMFRVKFFVIDELQGPGLSVRVMAGA